MCLASLSYFLQGTRSTAYSLWVWSEQAVSEAMLQAVDTLHEQGYEWEWASSHGLVISVAHSETVDTVEGLLSAAGWEHIRRVLL